MKKIFFTLSILLIFFSCQRQPAHNVSWDAAGNKMVKVQSYDRNGNLVEYFMAYTLFNSLYNNGGYNSVNHHYYENRPAYDRSYSNYSRRYSYSDNPKSRVHSSTGMSYRSSSPSRSSTSHYNASSPNRTVRKSSGFFSSFRSSPSRSSSSSFRSSSPSRSSSSFRSSSPSRRR